MKFWTIIVLDRIYMFSYLDFICPPFPNGLSKVKIFTRNMFISRFLDNIFRMIF